MPQTNEALCERCNQPVDVIRECDFVRLICRNPSCRFVEDIDEDFDDYDDWYSGREYFA